MTQESIFRYKFEIREGRGNNRSALSSCHAYRLELDFLYNQPNIRALRPGDTVTGLAMDLSVKAFSAFAYGLVNDTFMAKRKL